LEENTMAAVRGVDVKSLSLKEINLLKDELDKEAVAKRKQLQADLRSRIESIVTREGFQLSDIYPLMNRKRAHRPIPSAKFVNPNNPSQTWSGRGRKPGWFTEQKGSRQPEGVGA
jgi:DNA-binding protein H-NS